MIAAAALGDATVVLIEAPVGYGKTTLAEQLVGAGDRVTVRLRAGTLGTELADWVGRALRRSGLPFAADAMNSAEPFDSLLGALAAQGTAIDLLFDDAHLLGRDDASALADLIRDLPSGSRAIVSGRDLAMFAQLADRPGARWVDADDLRFGSSDVAALIGRPADHGAVTELLAATQGWPAAVVLAADRLRRDRHWSPAGASGARALLGSLVAELVAADPRVGLLAQLPFYDDEVISLIDGTADRPVSLPTRRIGRWRTVPAAVRELVDTERLPPPTLLAVARHYHRSGEVSAAVALLRETCPPATLSQFLGELRWSELAELSPAELRSAVEALDEPGTDAPADLLVQAARAVELRDRPLRREWLDRAVTSAAGATLRAAQAELARDLLRSADIDAGAALAEEVLAASPSNEFVTRARALVTIGMRDAFTCTPASLAQAATAFAQAAALFRAASETALQAETLARLGYTALYMAGRPAEGQAAMADALALLPVGDRVRAYWLTFYADLLDFVGRADEADAAVREALDIGTQHRDETSIGMAWWTRSWLAARRGDRTGLREALLQVERNRGGWLHGGQEAEFLASSAENLSLVGDVVGYHEYLQRAEQIAAEIDYGEVITIARSCYEAEHGDAALGLRLLAELENSPAVIPASTPLRALLSAVAHARLGKRDVAQAELDRALAAANAMGLPDLHSRMHAPQLAVLSGVIPTPARFAAATPRLRLLGGFALAIGSDDRTPQAGHPATLVKLLALRGTLTTEAAIDVLWPELDVATGRARLRNMLSRLKERSGALVVRDGDLLRLDSAVHVDVVAFETAASAALSASAQARVGSARHALAMYTGELLPGDVYEEWTAVDRARLQRRFTSLADLVAADAIARGDLDEAARLLDLGIASEPLDETRSLRLCELLSRQGRIDAARQVALRCIDVLDEIDVEPSVELTRFATI